ncbi:MAG TPA: L,D-transpeptidase [Pyrinomonadaceae bacterium]|nr:L,D-transpeptidase [Pyrinomonadaceae bacterium]
MKYCLLVTALVGCLCSFGCRSAISARQIVLTKSKEETTYPALQRQTLKLPLIDPRIIVTKSERKLELISGGVVVRTYHIGLGLNPVDDKERQGDRATPEGEFYIFTRNDKSAYYLSLGISYPNIEDADRGLSERLISRSQHDAIVKAIKRKAKPPQNTALGGDIYIHGNGARSDWTWGCVALENEDIRELFNAVPVGTPVTIKH